MRELTTYIIHIVLTLIGVYFVFAFCNLDRNFVNNAAAFILIYFIFWLGSYLYDRSHFVKVPRTLGLLFYFIKELAIASVVVAWDVLTPRSRIESGVIALPLDAESNLEITILASLISLTPGTLSLDVSEDRRFLYVHAVYIKNGDVGGLKQQIKNGFERKLLEITRTYHG
ncbi:MAG: Na+/H+ antiporter subunit E [Bacteroidales bacterium]